jgi:hypothetical protein
MPGRAGKTRSTKTWNAIATQFGVSSLQVRHHEQPVVRSVAPRAPTNRSFNRIVKKIVACFAARSFGSLQTFFALSQLRDASVMFDG